MLASQASSIPAHGPNTCLIVEDSDFDRERLRRVIRKTRSHMRIEEVATLRRARHALEQGSIGLILLDNNLPDGLGSEFALEVASDPRCAGIPIIIISDWPTPFMWEKAASAGVIHVLSKSEFDASFVASALQNAARRRVN